MLVGATQRRARFLRTMKRLGARRVASHSSRFRRPVHRGTRRVRRVPVVRRSTVTHGKDPPEPPAEQPSEGACSRAARGSAGTVSSRRAIFASPCSRGRR
jgi:hypothetical protein